MSRFRPAERKLLVLTQLLVLTHDFHVQADFDYTLSKHEALHLVKTNG